MGTEKDEIAALRHELDELKMLQLKRVAYELAMTTTLRHVMGELFFALAAKDPKRFREFCDSAERQVTEILENQVSVAGQADEVNAAIRNMASDFATQMIVGIIPSSPN